jgi:hypothetical protein
MCFFALNGMIIFVTYKRMAGLKEMIESYALKASTFKFSVINKNDNVIDS